MNVRHTWLALALTSALASGCGSGSQNNSPAAAGPTAPDNQALSFSMNLGPFGGANRADVLMINTPDPGVDTPMVVNLNSQNRGGAVEEAAQPREDSGPTRDLSPELAAAERAEFEAGLQKRVDSTEVIQARFQELAQGDQFTFNLPGQKTVVTQKILSEAQTLHCVVFAEVVAGQPIMSEARALQFSNAWDLDNPFRPGSGIYDQVRAAFGSEWNINPQGGRDGDEKVVLVFLTKESAGNDGTFGFFRPTDELTKAQAASSNEGEILYINADEQDFDVLATLAHEFQHMVRFNQKTIQNGVFAAQVENSTINEGCSVNAEELCGYSLTAAGGGNSFIFNTVNAYLKKGSNTNLFGPLGGSEFYGGGYLIVKYFREQLGDAAFLQFNTNTGVGYDNLVAVAGSSRERFFWEFSSALLASGFTGNVPAAARFPSGFTTTSSFDIRGLGQVTLVGLQPKQVTGNPSDATSINVVPYSPTLLRIDGGSGNPLILAGTVGRQSAFEVMLQSVPGTISEVIIQTFGDIQQ